MNARDFRFFKQDLNLFVSFLPTIFSHKIQNTTTLEEVGLRMYEDQQLQACKYYSDDLCMHI